MTGWSPKASAFCVPETAKSPSPAPSNTSTGLRSPVNAGKPVEGNHAGKQRDRQIAPIADRRRRHRADQQVASDAPGIARRNRQDQNPEQIEPVPDPRRCTAQREDKSTDEVEHQQERSHRRFSIAPLRY